MLHTCSFYWVWAMSFIIIIIIFITHFFYGGESGVGDRGNTWTTFFIENKLNFRCNKTIFVSLLKITDKLINTSRPPL